MYDGCWETVQIIDALGPFTSPFREMPAEEILENKDKYGWAEGYIRVNEKDMSKFKDIGFLDMAGKKLVGGKGLDYVEYKVVGLENGDTFVLYVS